MEISNFEKLVNLAAIWYRNGFVKVPRSKSANITGNCTSSTPNLKHARIRMIEPIVWRGAELGYA